MAEQALSLDESWLSGTTANVLNLGVAVPDAQRFLAGWTEADARALHGRLLEVLSAYIRRFPTPPSTPNGDFAKRKISEIFPPAKSKPSARLVNVRILKLALPNNPQEIGGLRATSLQIWAVMVLEAAAAGDITAALAAHSELKQVQLEALRSFAKAGLDARRRASKGGKARKGYSDPLPRAIAYVCTKLPKCTFDNVLDRLSDEDWVNQAFYRDKIDIEVRGVDWQEKVIYYKKRGDKGTDDLRECAFKTVKNYVGRYTKRRQKTP
jgi:hypothetical protein